MKSFLLFLVFSCLLFSSCTRLLYRAEQVHDPMITEKGGIKASAGVRVSPMDKIPSIDIGVGISPIDRLVVKGALRLRRYSEVSRVNNVIVSNEYFRGNTLEAGLGYYLPVAEKQYFVVYGSFMKGMNNHYATNDSSGIMIDTLYSNYNAFSIQPAFVFHRRVISASVGMRFSMYQYNNIYTAGLQADPRIYTNKNGKWYPVWDPYFNIEIGRSMIRGNVQAGFSFIQRDLALKAKGLTGNLVGTDELNPQSFLKISIGLAVDLNYLKSKK